MHDVKGIFALNYADTLSIPVMVVHICTYYLDIASILYKWKHTVNCYELEDQNNFNNVHKIYVIYSIFNAKQTPKSLK